jgi:valyl-tRNA synthetase
LVKTWQIDNNAQQPESSALAIKWFQESLKQVIATINDHFDKFRISEALMCIYNFFWNEFSSWFLEIIKPAYQQPIDSQTYNATIDIFDDLAHILHPFMPFITEEIWQNLKERQKGESLMINFMPKSTAFDEEFLQQFDKVKETIVFIRNIRQEKNISFKEELQLSVLKGEDGYYPEYNSVLKKMGILSNITEVNEKVNNAVSFFIKSTEFFLPTENNIDIDEEISKLVKELERVEKFLQSVENKLNNEKFIKNAPENVVNLEKQKKTDAEDKINVLKESILNMKNKKND